MYRVSLNPGAGISKEEFSNHQKDMVQRKALSEGVTTAGGYLVPDEWEAEIVSVVNRKDMLSGRVTNLTVGSDTLYVNNESTEPALAWIGEGNSISAGTTDPAFAQSTISIYKRAALWLLSSELIADNISNVDQWLRQRAAEKIAQDTEDHIISGTGSSQPFGIINSVTVPAGQIETYTTLAFDDLVNTTYKLGRQYRKKCIWGLPTAVVLAARVLKDSENRPIFIERMAETIPERILGYDVIENDEWHTGVTPGQETDGYFVDPNYYVKATRAGIQIAVSDQFKFDNDQIALRIIYRWGGKYITTQAIAKLDGPS